LIQVEITERQYELIDDALERQQDELEELASTVSNNRQNEIEELRAILWEAGEMAW
jgi:hypothetical protein